jgi:hypothetical protein
MIFIERENDSMIFPGAQIPGDEMCPLMSALTEFAAVVTSVEEVEDMEVPVFVKEGDIARPGVQAVR